MDVEGCGGERSAAQPADGAGRGAGRAAGSVPESGWADAGAKHEKVAGDCFALSPRSYAESTASAAGGGGIVAGAGRRAAWDCRSASINLRAAACCAAGDSDTERRA